MLPEKPWKPEAVLRLLTLLFASNFAGLLLADLLSRLAAEYQIHQQFVMVLVGTLSFHGMAVVLVHYFLRRHETDWSGAFGFKSRRLGRSLLLGGLVGIGILPLAWSLAHLSALIMEWFNRKPELQTTVETLQTAAPMGLKVMIGVFAVLVAPVVEEVIFRGILYPTVKQMGFPRVALWGTSLLFAVIHVNLMIVLPLTLLAVVLALLYESTNNLLAPILTHSLFNLANYFWVMTAASPN